MSAEVDTIAELIDVRKSVDQILRSAQYELEMKERELEELRRQAVRNNFAWYTEEQLAARMQISTETLARMRRARKIPHSSPAPRVVRYTSEDELEIARILREGRQRKLRRAA